MIKPELKQIYDARLKECHPDLQRLFNEVAKVREFAVICGYRGKDDQNKAYNQGKSKLIWPHSKHNILPSMATDVMPWTNYEPNIRWDDLPGVKAFAVIVLTMAGNLGIKVQWGGNWQRFKDWDHWELK